LRNTQGVPDFGLRNGRTVQCATSDFGWRISNLHRHNGPKTPPTFIRTLVRSQFRVPGRLAPSHLQERHFREHRFPCKRRGLGANGIVPGGPSIPKFEIRISKFGGRLPRIMRRPAISQSARAQQPHDALRPGLNPKILEVVATQNVEMSRIRPFRKARTVRTLGTADCTAQTQYGLRAGWWKITSAHLLSARRREISHVPLRPVSAIRVVRPSAH